MLDPGEKAGDEAGPIIDHRDQSVEFAVVEVGESGRRRLKDEVHRCVCAFALRRDGPTREDVGISYMVRCGTTPNIARQLFWLRKKLLARLLHPQTGARSQLVQLKGEPEC